MQGAAPAGLVEEMNDDVDDKADAVANRGFVDLVFRSDERPIDEERAAYDVFAGHEAPVTAVEAHGAIIAHGKVFARRDDQIVPLNVIRQVYGPFGGYIAAF